MKQFNGKGKYFEYIGDGRCENTLFSDIVYNDGGVIRYFDEVPTGWIYNSDVNTYFDSSVIRRPTNSGKTYLY